MILHIHPWRNHFFLFALSRPLDTTLHTPFHQPTNKDSIAQMATFNISQRQHLFLECQIITLTNLKLETQDGSLTIDYLDLKMCKLCTNIKNKFYFKCRIWKLPYQKRLKVDPYAQVHRTHIAIEMHNAVIPLNIMELGAGFPTV